jgi:hypothetical protein
MPKKIAEFISGGALIWLSICYCAAAGAAGPANRPQPAFAAASTESGAALQGERGPAPASAAPSRASTDPRECLKLSTNLEIASCAERFRPKSRR